MKRRELREHVFQLLFRVEFNSSEEMDEQVSMYFDGVREEETLAEKDETYITEKYKKIPEIDEMLNASAKGWKTSRMGRVDLTILRLAVYEMKFDEDIPEKVAINEAVELSKKFGGDESPAFINGVLAKIAGKISKEDVKEAIKRVGLDPNSKKHVGKYSLGMKQRLGIAQAIMEDPDILILDEPMNGLDESGIEDMRKLILEFRKTGKIVLIASHNKEDIQVLCDEVFEMKNGKLCNKETA